MKEASTSNSSIANGISEVDFFRLLKDRIFVDYFNVFLTLPVFEQRVLYKCLTDEFEFDPPVKSAMPKVHADRTRTLNWLYTFRLPLFLKTNLYLEYKLCRKLIASESKKSSDTSQHQLLLESDNTVNRFEDAIGHVTGMRQFRQFLDRGPGSKMLRLWLDVERFFGVPATDPMTRWMLFREIQVTFYDFENCATDWQQLSGQSPCVLIDGRGFAEVQCFQFVPNPTMSEREINAFMSGTYSYQKQQQQPNVADGISLECLRTLQTLLLRILRDYWLNKWLLHRNTVEWLTSGPKDTDEDDDEVEKGERDEMDGEMSVDQLKNEMDRMVKTWPAQKSPDSVSPGVVADDSFRLSPDTNEVIILQDDGSFTLSRIDPAQAAKVIVTSAIKRAMETYLSSKAVDDGTMGSTHSMSVSQSSISLASKASGSSLSGTSLKSAASAVSSLNVIRTLLPPVNTAARKSMTLSGTKEGQRDSQDVDHQMRLKIVELRRLTSNCQELTNITVRGLSKTAFPAPASATEVCRKPSQPLLATEPATSTTLGYRDDHQSFLRGIVADRLAGGPFEEYLVNEGCDDSRLILNFWRDAQVYLSCKGMGETSIQAYMRCRRAKVLITRYLTGHADKRLCFLAPTLRYSLQRHLAIGKGDDLMRRAQDVAIEFLRPMWQSYLQNDTVTFQNSVVAIRRDLVGFALKPKSNRIAPDYFQAKEPVDKEQETKSGAEDPVMLERARSYEAARRTELALQYLIDMSEFCLDNLIVENYPESEIRIFPDTFYGSLAVKKFRIFSRPDILLELKRRRFLDQLEWLRKPSIEEDYDDDLESIQSSIRPFMKGNKVITRPDRPASCEAIFDDPVHLEFFHRYLVAVKAGITALLFYLDVDKLKETRNPVRQKEKLKEILGTYFKTVEDVKKLKCDSRVLETIHYLPQQTTLERLFLAQSAVRKCLLDRWCEKYMKTFTEQERSKADEKRRANYDLWRKFLRGVIKLRHDLLDDVTMPEFESFVLQETAKDIAAGKTYEMKTFMTQSTLKVHLENVIHDIRFMREIEIYRVLCDQVKRLKRKLLVVKEEEDHVMAEAVRIYDLYLSSGPATVNICPEAKNSVAKLIEAGAIDRSLFHGAVLEIYPLVDLWWRKFVNSKGRAETFWDKLGAIIREKRSKKTRKKFSSESDLDRDAMLLRRKVGKGGRQAAAKQTDIFNIKQALHFDDDRVHIVFSILNGLRLYLPAALKTEHTKAARQLIPGVFQIFYELPSIQTQGRASDGLYDALQLRRMQTFMASRERKAFPVFVVGGTTYVLIQSLDQAGRQLLQKTVSGTSHRLGQS